MRSQFSPLCDLREGAQGQRSWLGWGLGKEIFQIMFMGWVETFHGPQERGMNKLDGGLHGTVHVLLLWGEPSMRYPLGGVEHYLCAGLLTYLTVNWVCCGLRAFAQTPS